MCRRVKILMPPKEKQYNIYNLLYKKTTVSLKMTRNPVTCKKDNIGNVNSMLPCTLLKAAKLHLQAAV